MGTQETPAIALDRLVKRYKRVEAVDGISFTLAAGSVTGLLGGNGAGKTTTIAMIMGLVTPTAGMVKVLGAEMPRERYRVLHRMNFESPYVDMPMRLTVRQNLSVFAQLYAVSDIGERIANLAADLDLTEFLDRPTGKLSAGQKTRVSLAKSLLNKPEILLLDEPTASLDPDTADWVRTRLEQYQAENGATVLLASHNMTFLVLVGTGFAGAAVVWALLPETLNTRAAEPVSLPSMLRSYRIVGRNPAYLAYLAVTSASYAGLFAWISGSAFVLQDLYGLAPFDFGVAFALGSVGYMTGSAIAARLVIRLGLDGVLGLGGCACVAGGVAMVAAVAFGLMSSMSLVLPMAVYLAGLGMVLPQGIAGAMAPFPERAGAASSLFGFVQQTAAAICGATVGWFLGQSAWPLAAGVAVMGLATLGLWVTTRGLRARVAKH